MRRREKDRKKEGGGAFDELADVDVDVVQRDLARFDLGIVQNITVKQIFHYVFNFFAIFN